MAARSAEARDCLERSSLVLDELDSVVHAWVYRRIAAYTKELLGDLAGAEQEQAAKWVGLQDERPSGHSARALQAVYELGLLYCSAGRWDDAEQCLVHGREVPEPVFYRPEAVLRLALEARVAANRGAADDAVTLVRRAVERLEGSDLLNWRARLWRVRAEVERDIGREAEAAVAVGRALELYDAKGNIAAAAQLRGPAMHSH
jgi:tetratricopeptide (TPR) repeat protein